MKKLFILIISVLFSLRAQAQLQVLASGLTKTPCVKIEQYGPTTIQPYGIYNTLVGSPYSDNMGIISQVGVNYNGYVSDPNHQTRKSIGIIGHAEDAYKYNFGVYGNVPETPMTTIGAAIYGTNTMSYLDVGTLFAGFFDGKVKTTDNLYVDGVICGTLVNVAPLSLRSSSSMNGLHRSVMSQLSTLQAGEFYIEQPQYKEVFADYLDSTLTTELAKEVPTRKISQNVTKRHYGLSAEELEEVFPDLVYDNEDGTKSINYVEMVPILVQAINELNAKIEVLEGGDGDVKKVKSQATNTDEMAENVTMLSLAQNKPNPFGTSTTIEVSIPEDVQTAFIYVYDLTGKKLQQVDIAARGKQAVTLNAATLTDGMYLYSLIADGKVVETRRMIVEK